MERRFDPSAKTYWKPAAQRDRFQPIFSPVLGETDYSDTSPLRRSVHEAMPRMPTRDDFARQAEEPSPGLLRELLDFLVYNKAWWLTPIVVVLLAGRPVDRSAEAAPFIYPLF